MTAAVLDDGGAGVPSVISLSGTLRRAHRRDLQTRDQWARCDS
jgi:hypothetical protein